MQAMYPASHLSLIDWLLVRVVGEFNWPSPGICVKTDNPAMDSSWGHDWQQLLCLRRLPWMNFPTRSGRLETKKSTAESGNCIIVCTLLAIRACGSTDYLRITRCIIIALQSTGKVPS